MLLTNGRIYLMDAWNTVVDTLVVRDDELVEVTPTSIRLRKKILKANQR